MLNGFGTFPFWADSVCIEWLVPDRPTCAKLREFAPLEIDFRTLKDCAKQHRIGTKSGASKPMETTATRVLCSRGFLSGFLGSGSSAQYSLGTGMCQEARPGRERMRDMARMAAWLCGESRSSARGPALAGTGGRDEFQYALVETRKGLRKRIIVSGKRR